MSHGMAWKWPIMIGGFIHSHCTGKPDEPRFTQFFVFRIIKDGKGAGQTKGHFNNSVGATFLSSSQDNVSAIYHLLASIMNRITFAWCHKLDGMICNHLNRRETCQPTWWLSQRLGMMQCGRLAIMILRELSISELGSVWKKTLVVALVSL